MTARLKHATRRASGMWGIDLADGAVWHYHCLDCGRPSFSPFTVATAGLCVPCYEPRRTNGGDVASSAGAAVEKAGF